jgi:predicted O-methyltransferase YrrM
MNKYPETFKKLSEIGTPESYRATFAHAEALISPFHALIPFLPPLQGREWASTVNPQWFNAVQGSLRVTDALKLYEMAYFSNGNILELGCFHGLSTCILSQGNHDRPEHDMVTLISVDINAQHVAYAEESLLAKGLRGGTVVLVADATEVVRDHSLSKREYGFVFVDHSHEYTPVKEVCQNLHLIIRHGGFVLFHDYNDKRNLDTKSDEYRVYQGVDAGLRKDSFEFYGIFGCCALYRRV